MAPLFIPIEWLLTYSLKGKKFIPNRALKTVLVRKTPALRRSFATEPQPLINFVVIECNISQEK